MRTGVDWLGYFHLQRESALAKCRSEDAAPRALSSCYALRVTDSVTPAGVHDWGRLRSCPLWSLRAYAALSTPVKPFPKCGNDRTELGNAAGGIPVAAQFYNDGYRPILGATKHPAGIATLSVRDGGNGIAPEDLTRVFERFERAVSSAHHGGLGIGLFLVRRLVEAHGGFVAAHSAQGQGATFVVTLPRTEIVQ